MEITGFSTKFASWSPSEQYVPWGKESQCWTVHMCACTHRHKHTGNSEFHGTLGTKTQHSFKAIGKTTLLIHKSLGKRKANCGIRGGTLLGLFQQPWQRCIFQEKRERLSGFISRPFFQNNIAWQCRLPSPLETEACTKYLLYFYSALQPKQFPSRLQKY